MEYFPLYRALKGLHLVFVKGDKLPHLLEVGFVTPCEESPSFCEKFVTEASVVVFRERADV